MLRDLWANTRKIAILAMSTPMKTVNNYRHDWWEDNSRFRTNDALAAALAAGDEEMTVSDGTKFLEDDVWEVNDGTNVEHVIVNGVPNDATVPIAWLDGTGTGFNNATRLIFISNASKEGAAAPASTATSPDLLYNYVTEIRVTFELSDWQKMMDMEWGKEDRRLKDLKYNDFVEQIEKSALFGRRSLRKVDGQNQTTSAGMLPQITTNNIAVNTLGNANTSVSKAELLEVFEIVGDNDADSMYLLSGRWFAGNIINALAMNDLQTTMTDKKYGINVKQLTTLDYNVDLVTHRLLHHNGSTNRYDLYGAYGIFLPKDNFSQFGFGENGKIAFKLKTPDDQSDFTRKYVGEHSVTRGWKLFNESQAYAVYGGVGIE